MALPSSRAWDLPIKESGYLMSVVAWRVVASLTALCHEAAT